MRKHTDGDVVAARWEVGATPLAGGTYALDGGSWTFRQHAPVGRTYGPDGGSWTFRRHEGGRPRHLRMVVALLAALALLAAGTVPALAGGAAGASASAQAGGSDGAAVAGLSSVIVVAEPGEHAAATAAVVALGGRLGAPLGVIDGFVANIPGDRIDDVQAHDAIRVVRPNGAVSLSDTAGSGSGVALSRIRRQGVDEFEEEGFSGQGVDVAIIDSGVTPIAGLDEPGKVLHGPDLSNEAGFPNLAHLDTYGHGTHLAGIIAGDDGPDGDFHGMATGARIVSLKVANATGETNIAQLIAAIDWVVEHRNTDGLNIRVLNLSLGLDDVPTHLDDPLSAAVERAWDAGIVVVTAAGNRGNTTGGLDSPAVSPYVIAVGASESVNSDPEDDLVPFWTSGGNGDRDPDFLAPGRSLVSLRVPGSYIDANYPQAREGDRFFKGSGTSQAAAVVSGLAALALSADPTLTPDQVKYVFRRSSDDLIDDRTIEGKGRIEPDDVEDDLSKKYRARVQTHPRALGLQSTADIVAPAGATWSNGTWSGATWSGATWSGATWSGATWSGATWSGATWSGATWSGATWSGATWSGATWSGATWSGETWTTAFWD